MASSRSWNASWPMKRSGLHEQGNMQLVKEEVDEDDIAAVVARWTGIPVSTTA